MQLFELLLIIVLTLYFLSMMLEMAGDTFLKVKELRKLIRDAKQGKGYKVQRSIKRVYEKSEVQDFDGFKEIADKVLGMPYKTDNPEYIEKVNELFFDDTLALMELDLMLKGEDYTDHVEVDGHLTKLIESLDTHYERFLLMDNDLDVMEEVKDAE